MGFFYILVLMILLGLNKKEAGVAGQPYFLVLLNGIYLFI